MLLLLIAWPVPLARRFPRRSLRQLRGGLCRNPVAGTTQWATGAATAAGPCVFQWLVSGADRLARVGADPLQLAAPVAGPAGSAALGGLHNSPATEQADYRREPGPCSPSRSPAATAGCWRPRGWTINPADNRFAARRGGPAASACWCTPSGAADAGAVSEPWQTGSSGSWPPTVLGPAGPHHHPTGHHLEDFQIDRDPAGRTEQFRSRLALSDLETAQEISVNHPLRHRGITIYQADWSLGGDHVQIGRSPELQLPLQSYPELGEQIRGCGCRPRPDGTEPVFLSLESEQGPVTVFNSDGTALTTLRPGGPAEEVNGPPCGWPRCLPASGLLLKRDPGVPLVYLGFAVLLVGGGLQPDRHRQLWASPPTGSCMWVDCATATWRPSQQNCQHCSKQLNAGATAATAMTQPTD